MHLIVNFFTEQNITTLTILFSLALLIYCYLRKVTSVGGVAIGYICICSCLNPYVFSLTIKDTIDTLQQFSWLFFVLMQFFSQTEQISFLLIGISTVFNPSNILFFFLNAIIKPDITIKKGVIFLLGIGAGVIIFNSSSKLYQQYYESLYFPQSFSPQFNLLWMLYAHMFDRFLHLYQLIFLILQISSLFLVVTIKVAVLTYFKVYCTYHCSELCMLFTFLIFTLMLNKQISTLICKWSKLNQVNEVVKIKTLTLIMVVANLVFFPLDKILLSKYLNDFSLNIGYLFLFFGFPWIINSIYLAQITLIINQLNRFHQHKFQNQVQCLQVESQETIEKTKEL